MLLPLIEKEVKKLFYAKIIVSLRFSKWVANLVLVRKKIEKSGYMWISGTSIEFP